MVTGPTVSLKIVFFFFNDTATTEIYTLSLHDALPISVEQRGIVAAGAPLRGLYAGDVLHVFDTLAIPLIVEGREVDRKSTRLNSSHSQISYAVFCLKKKHPADLMQARAFLKLHKPTCD